MTGPGGCARRRKGPHSGAHAGYPAVATPEDAPTPRTERAIVRALVHKTGLGHAEVNAELNKRIGLRRVTEATVVKLEKRLQAARKWLDRT